MGKFTIHLLGLGRWNPYTHGLGLPQDCWLHGLVWFVGVLTSVCHSNGHIETIPTREINPFYCPDQDSIPVSQDTMIDEQSSASGHDYASNRSAIGAGSVDCMESIVQELAICLSLWHACLGSFTTCRDVYLLPRSSTGIYLYRAPSRSRVYLCPFREWWVF